MAFYRSTEPTDRKTGGVPARHSFAVRAGADRGSRLEVLLVDLIQAELGPHCGGPGLVRRP